MKMKLIIIECKMQISFIELKSIESAFILLMLMMIIIRKGIFEKEKKQKIFRYDLLSVTLHIYIYIYIWNMMSIYMFKSENNIRCFVK